MNIKTLVTTFALVTISASSAMADVRITGKARLSYSSSGYSGMVIRDHRTPRATPAPVYTKPVPVTVRNASRFTPRHSRWEYNPPADPRPQYENGWITVAQGLHDSHDLVLGRHGTDIDTIMIRALDKSVTIGAVTIELMDGTRQDIGVSKAISYGETVVVPLDRRATIRSIRVWNSGGSQGAYSVFVN